MIKKHPWHFFKDITKHYWHLHRVTTPLCLAKTILEKKEDRDISLSNIKLCYEAIEIKMYDTEINIDSQTKGTELRAQRYILRST